MVAILCKTIGKQNKIVQTTGKRNKMVAILAKTIGKWNKMADHLKSEHHSKLDPRSAIRNLNMLGIQAPL